MINDVSWLMFTYKHKERKDRSPRNPADQCPEGVKT